MRLPKLCFIIALFFFISNNSFAQEQLGLKLENYSGINSVLLNPTYQLTSPLRWNVNLVSAGIFFDNNYGYIQDASLFKVLRRTEDIRPRPDINPETENINDFLILDFYDGNNKKQGSVSSTIMGPSVMVNLQSGWSLGLFTNYRIAASARKIPPSLNYYTFDSQADLEAFSVAPFKAAGMSWAELGFNVAKRIETAGGTIGLGINAKFLSGNEAFYFNNKSSFELTKLRADSAHFENLNVGYGYTSSLATDQNLKRQRNGSGLGLDIGFSYINELSDGDYLWKVGAALVDIGRIRYTQNAERHLIITEAAFELDYNDYENLSTIADQSNLLSLQVLNDSISSLDGTNFNVWLPTALTAYVDYHLTRHIYLNALLVQSVPVGENRVARDNQLAITPRYERRWFGAMLPVSFLNYRKLRVGAAMRLAFLTIGTEDLGSLLQQNEFTGSDFYVGVRINPFDLGGKGGGLLGKGKGKGTRCYDF